MQNYRYLTFQPDGVQKDALELGPRLDNLRTTVLNIHRVLLLLLLREHRPLQACASSPQIIILALLVDCKLVKDVIIYRMFYLANLHISNNMHSSPDL